MTSFGNSILCLGLLAAVLGASPGTSRSDPVLTRQVTSRIAEIWTVSPASLELEWGRSSDERPLTRADSVQLIGKGSDGFFTVMVRRDDGRSSTVRVRAGVYDSVWVAARALEVGDRIAQGDLRGEPHLCWGAPGTEEGLEPRVGWEVRRPVGPGERVDWPTLVEPPLVRAGHPIRLEWNRGGVTVSMDGVALNDARKGQLVRARVEERTGPLSATVTGKGTAVLQRGGDSCIASH